jgi:glycosyltransferase involved in cell wall biosynthesis
MNRPVLSIVIPTCDRPDTLEICLRALQKQSNPDVEILIQDNASDERTIDIIKRAEDKRIVHHRSETRISMRNNFEDGVAAATGDY